MFCSQLCTYAAPIGFPPGVFHSNICRRQGPAVSQDFPQFVRARYQRGGALLPGSCDSEREPVFQGPPGNQLVWSNYSGNWSLFPACVLEDPVSLQRTRATAYTCVGVVMCRQPPIWTITSSRRSLPSSTSPLHWPSSLMVTTQRTTSPSKQLSMPSTGPRTTSTLLGLGQTLPSAHCRPLGRPVTQLPQRRQKIWTQPSLLLHRRSTNKPSTPTPSATAPRPARISTRHKWR